MNNNNKRISMVGSVKTHHVQKSIYDCVAEYFDFWSKIKSQLKLFRRDKSTRPCFLLERLDLAEWKDYNKIRLKLSENLFAYVVNWNAVDGIFYE